MPFPLQHPSCVERDAPADDFTEDILFSGNLSRLFQSLHQRIAR